MAVLGLSGAGHDAAATVVSDNGDILFAGHAERYSRVKNDPDLNQDLMSAAWASTRGEAITDLAWYENTFLKHTRQIYSGEKKLFSKKFNPKKYVNEITHDFFKETPLTEYGHHLSHAAAGFQTSPFNDEAICVVIDAVGEWDCWSLWHAKYNSDGDAKYKKLWSIRYPHSLGLYYSAFTEYIGLKPNEEEYIMMGMAAYGDDICSHVYDDHVSWPPPMFRDMLGINFKFKLKNNLHVGIPYPRSQLNYFTNETIAASVQSATEDILSHMFLKVAQTCHKMKINNIVYMGGVALNCSANEGIFDRIDNWDFNVWIMPNPGDAGSSLGAAALKYGKRLNFESPFLGTDIPGEYPVKQLLGSLKTDKIVGVANGRAEFGPRAFGNRSLLADPRGEDIKDRVNKIKQRQEFRPFAPVILEEYADQYFGMPQLKSEYMQFTSHAKPRTVQEFPAIVHIDSTARVQTVPKDCKSGIRQLLEQWYFWSGGCPMLLNTSLNIKGEPMVDTIKDASRFEQEYEVKVW